MSSPTADRPAAQNPVGRGPATWRIPAIPPVVAPVMAAAGVGGLLALLTWKMFADMSFLGADFPNDTWYIKQQAAALSETHAPSLLLNADITVFYPLFAFYGGTLFVFAGLIALITGSAMVAQSIVYLIALAAAYGGWLWLGRLASLRSWQAHVPAILYVTAPYVLTNMYVRQDFAESVATAALPPLLASALSVLRADRLHAGPAAVLATATVTIGGSHNLTLLWSATILGIAALAFLLGVPQTRGQFTRSGALRVLAIVVPAMAVNSWYLLPNLAYHSDTIIVQRIDEWKALLRTPGPILDMRYLFALGRPSPFPGSGLTATLPALALAWVLVAAIAARARWRDPWFRALAILAILMITLLMIMKDGQALLVLPDPWVMLQFSYRLETFILFGICGAVIAGMALLRSTHRWLMVLLVPIAALSVIGATGQIRDSPLSSIDQTRDLDDMAAFSTGDFADASLRRLPPNAGVTPLVFTRADVEHGRLEFTAAAAPGDTLYVNVMSPPRMVRVQGASIVGRWAAAPIDTGWQSLWFLALRVDDDATPGEARIVVTQAKSLPIVSGRILSVLGLLGLAAIAVVIALRARHRRRATMT
jgi:hypothetical protein